MKNINTVKSLQSLPVESYSSVMNKAVLMRFVDFLDVSDCTLRSYISGIRRFIEFLQCKCIKTPTRQDVINFKRELTLSGKKPATVALYLSALRRFFSWCEAEGLYSDITRGIKAPKQDKGHKKDFLDGVKIFKLLNSINRNTVEGKRNYAILALMATCGLRTVEVVRANIEDIHVLGDITVLNIQGKGRSDKKEFVKLSEPVITAVREYLEVRGQFKDTEPLFASCSYRNRGKRLTTRTISGLCKNAMRKTGFNSSRLTAHSLRHSAVTLALMAGIELADVQHFARHSNIQTTQIYAHNVDRMKSMCEAKISEAIFAGRRMI